MPRTRNQAPRERVAERDSENMIQIQKLISLTIFFQLFVAVLGVGNENESVDISRADFTKIASVCPHLEEMINKKTVSDNPVVMSPECVRILPQIWGKSFVGNSGNVLRVTFEKYMVHTGNWDLAQLVDLKNAMVFALPTSVHSIIWELPQFTRQVKKLGIRNVPEADLLKICGKIHQP